LKGIGTPTLQKVLPIAIQTLPTPKTSFENKLKGVAKNLFGKFVTIMFGKIHLLLTL
jgi:hypothetical protein